MAVELPGQLDGRENFAQYHTRLGRTAAYVGLTDIQDLKRFLLTPWMLEQFMFFYQVAPDLYIITKLVLRLVNDDDTYSPEDSIVNPNPYAQWPIDSRVNPMTSNDDMLRHMEIARQLKMMRNAITSLDFDPLETNTSIDNTASAFTRATGKKLPPNLSSIWANTDIKIPQLGPFVHETPLEPYNRILCMLKLLQHHITRRHKWDARFRSPSALLGAAPIRARDIPRWRLVRRNTAAPRPASRHPILIVWKQDQAFPGSAQFLQRISAETDVVTEAYARFSPCAAVPGAVFRDHIRYLFRAEELRMDLRSARLVLPTDGSVIWPVRSLRDNLRHLRSVLDRSGSEQAGDNVIEVVFQECTPTAGHGYPYESRNRETGIQILRSLRSLV